MNLREKSLAEHASLKGKIEIKSKKKVSTKEELSLYYSPGVAEPCKEIAKNEEDVAKYTLRQNTVAIVSDGTAVLGLGNIGPKAALPVMEGKAMLFSEFADIYAYPLVVNAESDDDIINFCKMLEPSVGGILLEDIKAPNCVNIETRLKKELDIPVFHDDQHGTAIVTAAALINLERFTNKKLSNLTMILSGTGAAGSSIARMAKKLGITIYANNVDGVVSKQKYDQYDDVVKALIDDRIIESDIEEGKTFTDLFIGSDIFVGVSAPNIVSQEMIKKMNKNPWIFAMANPIPEIDPQSAIEAGAFFMGTGRSDFPNQVNNVLAFPGMFKGVLKANVVIDETMKLNVAKALAEYISDEELRQNYILPDTLDKGVASHIASTIVEAVNEDNK